MNKASAARTHMKMGTGGLSFGIGAQKYQVIMLFETPKVLENFNTKGWKAESGANTAAQFLNGMAI